MIRKILRVFRIVSIVIKKEIILSHPKKKKIVVFDNLSNFHILNNIFDKNLTYVMPVRATEMKKIYINIYIINYLIKNFLKNTLKINYLQALIKLIEPKVIITAVDNSIEFQRIAKELHKSINFIAIQQATREYTFFPRSWLKDVFIPEYYCIGNYDENIFRTKKLKVKKYKVFGSLKICKFLKKQKKENTKEIYDICLPSHGLPAPNYYNNLKKYKSKFNNRERSQYTDGDHIRKLYYSLDKTAVLIFNLSKKYNLKFVIASRYEKKNKNFNLEKNYFEKLFQSSKFKIIPNDIKNFGSYRTISKSKLIIGLNSSILRETLELKKKIFVCNFTGINNIYFPINNRFILKKENRNQFEKRFFSISKMSTKKYYKILGDSKNNIIHDSRNCDTILKKRVYELVQN